MIVSPGEVKITPSHVEITGFVFSETSRAESALEALRWAQEHIEDAKTEWTEWTEWSAEGHRRIKP